MTVERVEPDSDGRALVFAKGADGGSVAFHLPRESGDQMRELLDRGDVVMADLPEPGPSPLGVVDLRQITVERVGIHLVVRRNGSLSDRTLCRVRVDIIGPHLHGECSACEVVRAEHDRAASW